jgi:hypothetical protein
MQSFNLRPPAFGFLVGTRAALAFGVGLLVASRIPDERRKRIGLALLGLGAATTVPAIQLLRRSRTPPPIPVNGTQAEFDRSHTEFGFARPI